MIVTIKTTYYIYLKFNYLLLLLLLVVVDLIPIYT